LTLEDNFAVPNETLARFDPSMVNFLATQVSASLIFAKLARDTQDVDKRQRCLTNASEGYAIALYFLRQAQSQHHRVSPHIVEGMRTLMSMLREMGQSLHDL
jgi:hypothetical protein